jgi:Recombination endonuclease VII
MNAYNREYRLREEYKVQQKTYRANNAEKHRDYKILKQFGVTASEYDRMLVAQNGVCAICRQEESSRHQKGSVKRLAVDHCHSTGKVRGLLCERCNQVLGRIKDDSDIARGMATYLDANRE